MKESAIKEGDAGYWSERLPLYPIVATATGDTTYNDRPTFTFTALFRDTLRRFYSSCLNDFQ